MQCETSAKRLKLNVESTEAYWNNFPTNVRSRVERRLVISARRAINLKSIVYSIL